MNVRLMAAMGLVAVLMMAAATEVRAGSLVDNFDDGDYAGWSTGNLWGSDYGPSRVVASPEGYAISGIPDVGVPDCQGLLHRSISLQSTEVAMTLRSKSYAFPSNVSMVLTGSDPNQTPIYQLIDYGEFHRVDFGVTDGTCHDIYRFSYTIPDWTSSWRTIQCSRDSQGWWSLAVDGVTVGSNIYQDGTLTDFGFVGISASGPDAYIESVSVVPEPITLSLLVLGGLAVMRKYRTR